MIDNEIADLNQLRAYCQKQVVVSLVTHLDLITPETINSGKYDKQTKVHLLQSCHPWNHPVYWGCRSILQTLSLIHI